MTEAEIEVLLQRAREKYPEAKPRIISDNRPQFIARDFNPHRGDDPYTNLARLFAIEWPTGALAQIAKNRSASGRAQS